MSMRADGVTIRRATLDDLSALVSLETSFPGDRLSRRSFTRFLRGKTSVVLVAVGHEQADLYGNVVTLLRRGVRDARLYSLVTHPQQQRRGIAQALLTAAENEIHRCGYTGIRLEVRADNLAAQRLYATLGYDEYGIRPGYYADGMDARCLRKSLPALPP